MNNKQYRALLTENNPGILQSDNMGSYLPLVVMNHVLEAASHIEGGICIPESQLAYLAFVDDFILVVPKLTKTQDYLDSVMQKGKTFAGRNKRIDDLIHNH